MGEYLYKDEGYKIIGCCYEVYNTLKPGLLEAIYKLSLCVEFERQSVPYETEKALKVYYKGVLLPKTYFADIVCYGDVIIEAKAISTLTADHMAQLLNYMRITNTKVDYLVNFGNKELMEWKRVVL